MSDENPTSPGEALDRLLGIMAALRDPNTGCPWDAQQTMSSLTRYTIEEAYEAVDAIERGAAADIKDELGDLLFQIVFYAQIGKEQGDFEFADIANAISDKMERRHPHVFADADTDESALSAQWDAIKAQEKAETASPQASILSDVPTGLPALMYAQKIQKKCAKVGFDWPGIAPVLDKVTEEVDEIQAELQAEPVDSLRLEEEIGDALFAMVNLARHAKVDADAALRRASLKFAKRFSQVEQAAKLSNQQLSDMTLEELEQLWQQAKAKA
ncbi:nucleoside triphosphate pyrophosphohydrolase [Marisediminitalea aggregata]|uniref:nucleoside triphosphate pyrophosphohydrolase n=1 Tax=Marisediminitalea aggregata TaxID=634436 RepID=UPI0020CEF973|nr:nucleoside triphosphate pyrophosphohydrolase [Marisediminitalea aggregata]MCP9476586.1 nucleoside triphosphate pyrophosphohydrolase [Marisediminitalea aggregata]